MKQIAQRALNNELLVTGLILAVAFGVGFGYYRISTTTGAEQARARFVAESETRHTRLLGELAQRGQLLRSVVAYFNASNYVSEDEFQILSDSVLAEDSLMEICWHSSDGGSHFTGQLESNANACARFDPLEPSRIVPEDTPLIVLSKIATTKDDQQIGHASIIFDIVHLFYQEQGSSLNEFLVVIDGATDSSTTYTFREGRLMLVPASTQPLERADLSFDVANLGAVQFRYLTQQVVPAGENRANTIIAVFFIGLGLLGALYARSLIRTRALVEHEVNWRTAELTQFAYRTSHDLRGPLVTVGGLCQALREDVEEGNLDDLVDNTKRIEAHVLRMDNLVRDILQLTQADLGAESTELIMFDQLLDEIHQTLSENFPDHGVTLEVDVQAKCEFRLPLQRLTRVLENLISNSIKYANHEAQQPWVRTVISAESKRVTIQVKDNGLGIPEEFQSELYTMFARYHPKIGVQGSGLGLSIVKKHVDRLGGQILVDSTAHGTTFTLQLPNILEEVS